MVVLGGDVHDSWAYTVHEQGYSTGEPVGINLICPGVTSTGAGSAYGVALSPLERFISRENIERAVNEGAINTVPSLKFANLFNKGFYAVSVTPTTHTAEYFLIDGETLGSTYEQARAQSGKITANFFCPSSLESRANEKGSLDRSLTCGAITFDDARPVYYDVPVPAADFPDERALEDCGMRGCKLNEFPEPRAGECFPSERCAVGERGTYHFRMHKVAGDACILACFEDVTGRQQDGWKCGVCPFVF